MGADPVYKQWVDNYHKDRKLFDSDFAKAWFKLMHRSESHPKDNDLEMDAAKCTLFDFVGGSMSTTGNGTITSAEQTDSAAATFHPGIFAFFGTVSLLLF